MNRIRLALPLAGAFCAMLAAAALAADDMPKRKSGLWEIRMGAGGPTMSQCVDQTRDEAFRQMKTIQPNVCVLLSSGYNEVEAIRRFTGKGLAGFIQKPYSAVTLAEKVRAALDESHDGTGK